MSRPDGVAAAALDAPVIRPVFMAWLDVLGDPLRANTSGRDLTFSGTGDPELDGFTFTGISAQFVDIGEVAYEEGGSKTVTCRLSGIVGLDSDILNLLGVRSNWQGRTARLWRIIRDEYGTQAGAIQPYYTGWMTAMTIDPKPSSQTISLSIESYLAAFTAASNRSYLSQEQYDSGDLSARAAIAIANGTSGNVLINNTPVAGGIGGGWPGRYGRFDQRFN